MLFELGQSSRSRKCYCGRVIPPHEIHFVHTQWDKEIPYPIKRNICMYCANRITDDEFLKYLEVLIGKLKSLKVKVFPYKQIGEADNKRELPF